jgi:glycerophosphoryl diester phosphodiesterase
MRRFTTLLFLVISSNLLAQIYIPTFDLQGHRGARGIRPENSIPAFLIALDSGVTTLELDLAITKDKQIVVSHEPWMSAAICLQPDGSSISTSQEKSLNIYQMEYVQVQQFDCGSKGNEKFPEQLHMKTAKPLLRDVIVATEHHIKSYSLYEVDYNIEIKTSPAGDGTFHPSPEVLSDLVYNLIDQYLTLERVVIQSFDFRVLSPYFKVLTKEKVDYLHKLKVRVIPWTVNEIDDMKKLLEWKVDGFITDYPDRAAMIGLGIRPAAAVPR